MIRSGGENMSSAEIENVLADHPLVLAASVVGAPHPTWQEVPVAFVIGRPGLTAEALVEHARQRLGKFKVPKEIYLVRVPADPSGQGAQAVLRDLRRAVPGLDRRRGPGAISSGPPPAVPPPPTGMRSGPPGTYGS